LEPLWKRKHFVSGGLSAGLGTKDVPIATAPPTFASLRLAAGRGYATCPFMTE